MTSTSDITNIIRRERLSYGEFNKIVAAARKKAGLSKPKQGRKLPKVLPETALKAFYDAVDGAGNLQHRIMLRLLLYTAIRVSEHASIGVNDVDLGGSKIFIDQGKGSKDRYILFPDAFRLTVEAYMSSCPHNKYLFESRQRTKYSTRRIQQLVKEYAKEAGISQRVHPHLLRHQMLTWLTSQGMPDSQIQLISGHSSKKSLEVYQHLSLATVEDGYQKAVRKMEI